VVFESAVGSVYPIPAHKWAAKARELGVSRILGLDTPPADVVGLGPFRLKAFSADQRVVVERNPHYWQKDRWGNRLPYLDRVTWVVSPDFNASLQRFRAGEVHMYSRIQPDQVDLLERDAKKGDFSVHDLGPSLSTHYLVFNLNPGKDADGKPFLAPWLRAVFEDVRFRRAVSHAIDREGLVRTVLFGRGRPLHCIVSPANKAWHHPCPRYEHDPAKAKALLDELALTDRDGDGVREDAAGHPLEFSVITNVENALRVAAAASIQADLAAVGIRMRPRPVPFNALIRSFNTTYDWDAIILGWAAGVPPDPVMAKNIYLSSGRTHVWHPRQKKPTRPWEAEVDRLVGVLSSELDRGKRKAAHDRIVEVLGEQQAQVFTFNENVHVAARHGIGNLHPVVIRPYGYWNLAELFLEPPAE